MAIGIFKVVRSPLYFRCLILRTSQVYIDSLQRKLEECHIDGNTWAASLPFEASEPVVKCHLRIFQTGVWIYFNRTILNLPPKHFVSNVSSMLRDVDSYPKLGGGHATVWPIFMAALEAHRDNDKRVVMAWLRSADRGGVASCAVIRDFVEEVWRCRTRKAGLMGVEEADVVVDWMEVMDDTNPDLLLV